MTMDLEPSPLENPALTKAEIALRRNQDCRDEILALREQLLTMAKEIQALKAELWKHTGWCPSEGSRP